MQTLQECLRWKITMQTRLIIAKSNIQSWANNNSNLSTLELILRKFKKIIATVMCVWGAKGVFFLVLFVWSVLYWGCACVCFVLCVSVSVWKGRGGVGWVVLCHCGGCGVWLSWGVHPCMWMLCFGGVMCSWRWRVQFFFFCIYT